MGQQVPAQPTKVLDARKVLAPDYPAMRTAISPLTQSLEQRVGDGALPGPGKADKFQDERLAHCNGRGNTFPAREKIADR
jgi:hypothetical protein